MKLPLYPPAGSPERARSSPLGAEGLPLRAEDTSPLRAEGTAPLRTEGTAPLRTEGSSLRAEDPPLRTEGSPLRAEGSDRCSASAGRLHPHSGLQRDSWVEGDRMPVFKAHRCLVSLNSRLESNKEEGEDHPRYPQDQSMSPQFIAHRRVLWMILLGGMHEIASKPGVWGGRQEGRGLMLGWTAGNENNGRSFRNTGVTRSSETPTS